MDLTGQKFGKWTVIKYAGLNKYKKSLFLCRCECGTEREVLGSSLKNGRSKECGCCIEHAANFIDLTGQRFGRLTVVKKAPKKSYSKQSFWECKCDCGNIIVSSSQGLRNGHIKSCGCYSHELRVKESTKHGDSRTRLYIIWSNMKDRTIRKTCTPYKYYGERGIKVCNEWLNYEVFKEWALSHGYSDELTIDRIDVNGNYCPENCRWATLETQANNTRRNHFITYKGETHTIAEWSKITGLAEGTIRGRIIRGWETERLFIPLTRKGRRNGKNQG